MLKSVHMKSLISYYTLVQLRQSLLALHQLHNLLHTSSDIRIYSELLYEKTRIELDKYAFKSHLLSIFNDTSEVFLLIIRLLNNRLDFDLFFAMFVQGIYELEISVQYKKTSINNG